MSAQTPTLTFYNGQQMPLVGLGTWQTTCPEELENALDAALEAGYRHIDTAHVYSNEALIGNVLSRWLQEGKVTREQLFITTKLPSSGKHPTRVGQFLKKSLANLQLDYVDLYLIHDPWAIPFTGTDGEKPAFTKDGKFEIDRDSSLEETWKAMEDQLDLGLTKSIGISNFNSVQIERIVKVARIQPANVQVEVSAYCQKKEIRATCAKHGLTVCAYSPLGSPGSKDALAKVGIEFPSFGMLEDPVVLEIAEAHNRTPAQILLKFLVQQDVAVIPKSVKAERIRKNIQLFDFQLTDQDLEKLFNLDRGDAGRVCFSSFPGVDEHPEWPFRSNV